MPRLDEQGFTLIESMVAVGVLVIGIVGVYTMHVATIKGNSAGLAITEMSVAATDFIERLRRLPYDSHNNGLDDDGDGQVDETDERFDDRDGDGVAGLNDADPITANADYSQLSGDGRYRIFWNVAEDSPVANMKTVRVIVSTISGRSRTVRFTTAMNDI